MAKVARNRKPGCVAFSTRVLPVEAHRRLVALAKAKHWTVGHTHAAALERGLDAMERGDAGHVAAVG